MDIGTTAPVSGNSSTTSHPQLPSSTKQQAAQPGQAPSIGIRLPQSNILASASSGMPAVPVSAPQFSARATGDSPRSRLCAAARDGDGNAVKRMIQAGSGNLNTVDCATGLTALMLAAQHGHDDVVFLLCKGASANDIHRANAEGDSALMLAARHGQADTVKLLARKADLDQANQDGDTALILAARGGHVDIVMRLLVKGAQAGRCNASGVSALLAAEQAGHGKVVQLLQAVTIPAAAETMPASSAHAAAKADLAKAQNLLAAGVDGNEADDSGCAALFNAAHHELLATALDSIVANAGKDVRSSSGKPDTLAPLLPVPTTLHQAIERNNAEALMRLLVQLQRSGKNVVEEVNRVGKLEIQNNPWMIKEVTPLMTAAYFGYGQLLELLMVAGARVDKYHLGWTALTVAAGSGHTAIVQRLLLARAQVDPALTNVETALVIAAQNGHVATVQVLLQAGARINQGDGRGSALTRAAGNAHTATVQSLLQAGADCKLKSLFGDTALSIAIKGRHEEVIKLLRAHGASQ